MNKLIVTCATAALALCVLPASGAAAIQVQVVGGVLTVQGSAAAEVLNVSGPSPPAGVGFPGFPGYHVSDNVGRGQLVAGPGCTFSAGATGQDDVVTCAEDGVTAISVDAGAGGDQVTIGTSVSPNSRCR
jgi:hypothetical protein